jgi:hypothetical protein
LLHPFIAGNHALQAEDLGCLLFYEHCSPSKQVPY